MGYCLSLLKSSNLLATWCRSLTFSATLDISFNYFLVIIILFFPFSSLYLAGPSLGAYLLGPLWLKLTGSGVVDVTTVMGLWTYLELSFENFYSRVFDFSLFSGSIFWEEKGWTGLKEGGGGGGMGFMITLRLGLMNEPGGGG